MERMNNVNVRMLCGLEWKASDWKTSVARVALCAHELKFQLEFAQRSAFGRWTYMDLRTAEHRQRVRGNVLAYLQPSSSALRFVEERVRVLFGMRALEGPPEPWSPEADVMHRLPWQPMEAANEPVPFRGIVLLPQLGDFATTDLVLAECHAPGRWTAIPYGSSNAVGEDERASIGGVAYVSVSQWPLEELADVLHKMWHMQGILRTRWGTR